VALTARALGADGIILSDIEDKKIKETVDKITLNWGGTFSFAMGIPWRRAVSEWKNNGGIVVHLTAYGENIESSSAMKEIKHSGKDVMVIVGCQKVPGEFFAEEVSDFNVAVGNQPHSECASVAIFLDRFQRRKTLATDFPNARVRIIPQKRGKKVVSHGRFERLNSKEI
jgi:tRNA (cytidine56-2'-O)-methyltransferase